MHLDLSDRDDLGAPEPVLRVVHIADESHTAATTAGADSLKADVTRYEQAFALYIARDFAGALRLLEMQPDDSPSLVLGERCREFLAEPPPADWAGIYVSMSK
jgi:hypothetical protein